MPYELWYWPGIPGRGEFVRLALEAGDIPYRDRARSEGERGLIADMKARGDQPPFAPPYLVAGRRVIAQTANILLFLGEKHRLAPASESGRLWTNQLQLTITDLVAEIHDSHHPRLDQLGCGYGSVCGGAGGLCDGSAGGRGVVVAAGRHRIHGWVLGGARGACGAG